MYWLVGQEEEEDSGLVLTTHQCSAVEGLVHSPAHSHQTPLTSHCTRILQELHSQGNSCTHVLSVDRASVCRLRVSYTDRYKPQLINIAFILGNKVLSAIYIEPPADVRSVPQNYTIHCITTGQSSSNITVGMFLERHSQQYYIGNVPPVLGYSQDPPLLNTLNSTTLTYDTLRR